MDTKFTLRRTNRLSLLLNTVVVATVASNALAKPSVPTTDTIQTKDGPIRITPKFHGSFQITFAGKVFEIDPVSAAGYTRKADYILITHAHPDHLDPAALKKLIWEDNNYVAPEASDTTTNTTTTSSGAVTQIIAPEPIIKQLQASIKSADLTPLSNGHGIRIDTTVFTSDNSQKPRRQPKIGIDAVPMYNLVRGPKKGQKFHPKGDGNGYILTLGGKRIYIAGDTEATPEMKKLKNIDVAFLPMNLPFTMTPQEAAKGARAFKPKIVYPYHFRYPFDKANTNAHQFAAALKGSGIQVRVREWYPKAAVAKATAAAKK